MFVSPHVTNSIGRAQSVGVSAATLATLCGITPASLSNANRGIKNLGGKMEEALVRTSVLLVVIADSVSPLRLPADAANLNRLLQYVSDNNITPEAIKEALDKVLGIVVNQS